METVEEGLCGGDEEKGMVVVNPYEAWSLGWEGLGLFGEMDFMPNEWFWMADGAIQQ